MDVKFTKKLIWFGERTIRRHADDKNLIAAVQAQNVKMQDNLREYLAQNPDKDEPFNPEEDVAFYHKLEGSAKTSAENSNQKQPNTRKNKKNSGKKIGKKRLNKYD